MKLFSGSSFLWMIPSPLLLSHLHIPGATAFLPIPWSIARASSSPPSSLNAELSDLPVGISPFEKGEAKALDLESQFRNAAGRALEQARKDGRQQLEIEFPPLLFKGKTQFDDFDNVQELDLNRD